MYIKNYFATQSVVSDDCNRPAMDAPRTTKRDAKGATGSRLGRCFAPQDSTSQNGLWAAYQPGGRRRHLPAMLSSRVELVRGQHVPVTTYGR